MLLSTEAAGEGRNLQFCRTMVNFDLPWNPMRIEQRVGRIHRVGQTRQVEIFNLSAEGTVEDYILDILDRKLNMFELVIGEMDMILGQLADERDFEDLVMDVWARAQTPEEAAAGFAELGDALVEAREAYQHTREYDEALFGQDFAPNELNAETMTAKEISEKLGVSCALADEHETMTELADFVLNYCRRAGALVEPAPDGVYDVLLPDALAAQWRVPALQRFAFERRCKPVREVTRWATAIRSSSRWSRRCAASRCAAGCTSTRCAWTSTAWSTWPARRLAFPNARLVEAPRQTEARAMCHYVRFNFKAALITDEKREQLVSVMMDAQAGHAVKELARIEELAPLEAEPAFKNLSPAPMRWRQEAEPLSRAALEELLERATAVLRSTSWPRLSRASNATRRVTSNWTAPGWRNTMTRSSATCSAGPSAPPTKTSAPRSKASWPPCAPSARPSWPTWKPSTNCASRWSWSTCS